MPKYAVMLLVLLFAAPITPAQTARQSDINLTRLAEAAQAISQGDLPTAERLLNSILVSAPGDADALNLLGVVRAQEQKPVAAERLFRRAIAAAATHVGAQINLGKLLLTLNRNSEALQTFQAAHRLAPERAEINLGLASLYADSRDYQRALDYLRLVPRSSATDDYYPLLLSTLLGLKQLEEVRPLTNEFAAISRGKPEVQAEFAMLLAKGGFNDEAVDLLETAQKQTPEALPVLYALGVVAAARKQYERAEDYLSQALKAKPDDVMTLRALASVARATGNLEKSLAHLVQARRLAPDAPGVLYDFGVTTLQMDLLLDALPAFERLHRSRPQEPAYLYGLAAARFKKGELAEAVRLMRTYVDLRPKDAPGFYLLGAALHNLGQFAEARVALERSLELRPDPDAEYLLGVTLQKSGNRPAAMEVLERVVRARPEHAAAYAALGSVYREQGDDSQARAALERAVTLDPKDLRACYQLGLVYAKLGDKEAAKRMFERADDVREQQRNRESVILKIIDPPQE